MKAAEKFGFTKEVFNGLLGGGFDSEPNKNHPSYSENETFENFLETGSKKMLEDAELMDKIVKAF